MAFQIKVVRAYCSTLQWSMPWAQTNKKQSAYTQGESNGYILLQKMPIRSHRAQNRPKKHRCWKSSDCTNAKPITKNSKDVKMLYSLFVDDVRRRKKKITILQYLDKYKESMTIALHKRLMNNYDNYFCFCSWYLWHITWIIF